MLLIKTTMQKPSKRNKKTLPFPFLFHSTILQNEPIPNVLAVFLTSHCYPVMGARPFIARDHS